MYNIFRTSSFKKDYKDLSKTDKDKVKHIINQLASGCKLEQKYKDHKLTGDLKECRECHIRPDLLLIYKINNNELELMLIRVGSHSDLF